jgi:hypothetical protein
MVTGKHDAEREILNAALDKLRNQGLTAELVKAPLRGAHDADAFLRIGYGPRKTAYVIAVKGGLRPATLGAAIHQLERLGNRPLLVADYVTPPMAETLRARGIPFADAAGNIFLEQAPLLVWIQGQRPKKDIPDAGRGGRAFQASGLTVLFALICNPEWVALPYRTLAHKAGVAHGTVGWVMAELPRLGFLAVVHGRRQLQRRGPLLQQWAQFYPKVLRPKLLLGRYHVQDLAWWEALNPANYGAEFGGEPAGARLTKHLRPGTATFYAERVDPRLVVKLKLRADPAEGNVEFLRKFWNFAGQGRAIVPAPLVYADLMSTGEARSMETARMVYEAFFKTEHRPVGV